MKKVVPLLAVAAISMPAMADTTSGLYGSMGGGAYRLESSSFEDSAPSFRLLGGYSFNAMLSVEGSYSRLFESSDSFDGTSIKIDGNLWDVGARVSYPVTSRFSPYGRVGYGYIDARAKITDDEGRVGLNDYDDAFSWAVGASYGLKKRYAITGEYAAMNIGGGDLDTVSVNLNYRFGAF